MPSILGRFGKDVDKVVFHFAVGRRAVGSQTSSRAQAESRPGETLIGRGRHLDDQVEIVDAGLQGGHRLAGARSAEQLLIGLEAAVVVEIYPPVQVDRAGQLTGNRDSYRKGDRLALGEGDFAEVDPVIGAQVRLGTK